MKTLRLDHMASGRWQKTVSYKDCGPFRFDLESYNEFYNFTQGEYLPEVYSCVYTDEDTLELEYEHIHSEIKFPPIVIDEKGSRFINKTIKKIAWLLSLTFSDLVTRIQRPSIFLTAMFIFTQTLRWIIL